jgi:hypothetical protein
MKLTPDISLNSEEQMLFNEIEFDPLLLKNSDHARENGDAVFKLLKSLVQRKGIPQIRIRYFTDPEFNLGGRGRSKQEVFEKNGTSGEDIYRHPHFLYYFSYFLSGASLSSLVKEGFKQQVDRCGSITSGDISTLSNWVNQLTKSNKLDQGEGSEEFFKLAIECGINVSYSASIVKGIRKTKR